MNEKDVQRMIYQNNMRNLYYDNYKMKQVIKINKDRILDNLRSYLSSFIIDYLKETMNKCELKPIYGISKIEFTTNIKNDYMNNFLCLYKTYYDIDNENKEDICLDLYDSNGEIGLLSIRVKEFDTLKFNIYYSLSFDDFKKYFNLGEDYEIQI